MGRTMRDLNSPENKGRVENWSKYVKRREKEEVEISNLSEAIEGLVEDYKTDLSKVWILDMFANGVSKNHIYETAKLIFDEDMTTIIDIVETELESLGLSDMSRRLDSDLQVGEKIRTTIASEALSGIKNQVQELVNNSPKEIREGVYLLSHFAVDKLGQDRTHITPRGFERTWKIFSDDEDLEIQDLVNVGMLYKKYYQYDTGSHWYHVIPQHSLILLGELVEGESDLEPPCSPPSESEVRDFMEQEEVREFMKWMSSTTKYVDVSEEEEQIKEEMDEEKVDLSLAEFESVRDKMIEESVLIFDYSPQRSSTGDRSSKAASWKYKLTKLAIDSVPILQWRPSEFYSTT